MKIYIPSNEYLGDPEAVAMLQAFYSRSSEGIESRLEKLGTDLTSVKKALNRYHIGYGHASIGDCGDVTVFIEGVSILAAKALQDNPLYNGQECSTRYIDIGDNLYSPSPINKWWLETYKQVKELVLPGVRKEHPIEEGQSQTQWENATAARAFDIARGWLPCSLLTNLSVKLSLRKFSEFTTQLIAHPLEEVRNIALSIRNDLLERFPFGIKPLDEKDQAEIDWIKSKGPDYWYNPSSRSAYPIHCVYIDELGLSVNTLSLINDRPRYAILPHWLENDTRFTITGDIDYGTWRDLQRHRRNIGRGSIPRATEFHSWYLDQATRYIEDSNAAMAIRSSTQAQMENLREISISNTSLETAYDLPLGTTVYYEYSMGLAQAIYFAELRSGNTVHAILRPVAQQLARKLEDHGIKVYYDDQPARFDIRRGSQTISEKKE